MFVHAASAGGLDHSPSIPEIIQWETVAGFQFENGTILNPRFSKYRVPRFSDMPEIDVVLLDRKDLPPAGAGETP